MERLEWLNIVPMSVEHREELAADAAELCRSGCVTANAFIMSLVPEGEPPVPKAEILGERFLLFREAFRKTGTPCGILLQSTIGHGWTPNSPARFGRVVREDGESPYQFCPLDPDFQRYVEESVRHLAALRPDFFMVDDDFRLLTGRDGCFCERHIAEFNRRRGGGPAERAELVALLRRDEAAARCYDELLEESLVSLAGKIRKAIDATDPAIPCSFCCCSEDVRHAPAVARALAAPGQEIVIRINNARYLTDSPRATAPWLRKTALQVAAMPENCRILAEPDTFPHNRYSMSGTMFHSHLTFSILEGCRGGKLWLTRIGTFEPESGRVYREQLRHYAGFYRALAALNLHRDGVAVPLPVKPRFNFPASSEAEGENWGTQLFGRMGIPFRFTKEREGIVALAGSDCAFLSDEELREILKGRVLLDGAAAVCLSKRGFSGLIGVEASPWGLKAVTFERTGDGGVIPVSADASTVELRPLPGAESLSMLFHRESGISEEEQPLTPGAVCFRNPEGGIVAAVAVPVLPYGHLAFCMLNETRKRQLLQLLRLLGGLPFFGVGDGELLIETGETPSGRVLCAVNLGLDDLPELVLGDCAAVAAVEQLDPDGEWRPVPFRFDRELAQLRIFRELRPLHPVVLQLR